MAEILCDFCRKPATYLASLASGRMPHICLSMECVDKFGEFVRKIENDKVKHYTTISRSFEHGKSTPDNEGLVLSTTPKGNAPHARPRDATDGVRNPPGAQAPSKVRFRRLRP